MKNRSVFVLTFCLLVLFAGCQNPEEKSGGYKNEVNEDSSTQDTEPAVVSGESVVNVAALANKSHTEFDQVFGNAAKVSPVRVNEKHMPGEYREYPVAGHPKGLSVRFHKDEAKRFNLLLGAPSRSASEALMSEFVIDVSKLKKAKGDPLSDTWAGTFDGVKFKTVYAKRGKPGGNFIMLHAEVE